MAHSTVRERFTTFFEHWLLREECFLQLLLRNTIDEQPNTDLVDEVLVHYQQYYDEKAKAAHQHVFLFFSPPWLSSFECAMLWVTGFRPSLVFSIVKGSVGELSAEQALRMERVKVETIEKERETEEALMSVQESMVEQASLRRVGTLVDGEESAMEALEESMVVVVSNADAVRGCTVKKVLDILNPLQRVKLLAAFMHYQLQVRKWGLQSDSRNH